ncbi:MAG: hypothetical protein ACJ731_00565 [Vicinamibacterales bacterium]
MKKNKMWIGLVIVGLSSPLAAQRGTFERAPDSAASAQLYEKMVGEVRARTAVEARVTPGAPYSAEAITESTQALADGNRINRKSVTRVYRDGEGRTRREELDESGTVITVSIVDPVAHLSYVLNPTSRTAYRDPVRMATPAGGARGRGGVPAELVAKIDDEMRARRSAETAGTSDAPPPPPPAPRSPGAAPPPPPPAPLPPGTRAALERSASNNLVTENLGQQSLEGVNATGSRSTTTIPVGAIGNLQPIKIVAEQWFSPDLQVLVMTKHSDPRSGETTYRLQGIVRAEPDRSLFTVPPDYTLKESGIREPQMR